MSKDDFRRLFEKALEAAALNAEQKLDRAIPRTFQIEMNGLASRERILSSEEVLDELYLGPNLFYRVVDVSVIRISPHLSTIYLVVSGHAPVSFEQTWNQTLGSGPFKQVFADHIEVVG